jgi:hypothetical protein
MKQKKTNPVAKQIFLALFFLLIISISWGQKCNCTFYSDCGPCPNQTFATYAEALAYGTSPNCGCTASFAAQQIQCTSQCAGSSNNNSSGSGSSGNVKKTTYPFQVSPGQLTFPPESQGVPFFGNWQGSAFDDWAAEYRAQLAAYGITSYLGDKLDAPVIPVPLSGDPVSDNELSTKSDAFNPTMPPNQDPNVVDLSGVPLNQTVNMAVVGETPADGSNPLVTIDNINVPAIQAILTQGDQYITEDQINDIVNNMVELINNNTTETPIIASQGNSNSETFETVQVSTAPVGQNGGNTELTPGYLPTNIGPEEVEKTTLFEKEDNVVNLVGLAFGVNGPKMDFALLKAQNAYNEAVKIAAEFGNGENDLSDVLPELMNAEKLKGMSDVVGSFLGGMSVGIDMTKMYNDYQTEGLGVNFAVHTANLFTDGSLLIAGIAGVGAATTVFGLPVIYVSSITYGLSVTSAIVNYYNDKNKPHKN